MHTHHAPDSVVPETRIGTEERRRTMTTRDVTIAVFGSGGDGVVTLGDLLAITEQRVLLFVRRHLHGDLAVLERVRARLHRDTSFRAHDDVERP